jgi:hypothetical protein
VAGADEDAALPRAQREHVARAAQVTRQCPRIGEGPDRAGAARGRHAGTGADVVDADGEGRPVGVGVVGDHLREPECRTLLLAHRCADDAGGLPDDERHLLVGDQLGRDDEVALVLPVGIVDDHHHLS